MKRIISALILALLAITACTIDDTGTRGITKEGETTTSFSVNVPAAFSGPQSYTVGITDESAVETFHVFAFGTDGKLADYAAHNEITDDGLTPSFNVKFRNLTLGETYTFVVLANAEKQFEALAGHYVNTISKDELMGKFVLTDGSGITINRIPMWGEKTVTNLKDNENVTGLSLLRMMAKVNVKVASAIDSKFKLKSVRLYNYREDGKIVPASANMESAGKVKTPTLTGSNRVNGPLTFDKAADIDETNNQCVDRIYTFESNVPMTAGKADMANMHALVVGGKYNNGAETYYRINFREVAGENVTYLDILRNHSYTINITNVTGDGYTKPEDAFDSKGVSMLDATIIAWDENELTDIDFDGQFMLSVSKKEWEFDKDARTTSSTDNIIRIVTDYDDGKWSIVSKDSWLDIVAKSGNDHYITATAYPTGAPRVGYITIKAARVTSKITVTQTSTTATVLVSGVSLNKATTSIVEGSTEKLTATVTPANASNKTVSWSSSATNVATVAADGTITAHSAGTATITVTTAQGGLTAQCVVTVTSSKVDVTGVSLNKTSTTIAKGSSEKLTATVAPADATNKTVTWASSAPAVASVATDGTVTAHTVGTTTITVTTQDGSKTAQCAVTVTAAVTGVSLNKTSLPLKKGGSEKLTATVAPADATNKTVSWASSDTDVATVSSDGTVTAVTNGTATITVTTQDGNKTEECIVTVTTDVTGLTLTPSSASVEVGNTVPLTATVIPSSASNQLINWSSSNTGVATVANGVVTGVSAGPATITATTADGGFSQTSAITVTAPVPTVTTITLPVSAVLGMTQGTLTLTPEYTPAGSYTASWNSTDTDVATVENGIVTAVNAGTTQITATVGTVTSNICYLTVSNSTPSTLAGWAGSNIYWNGSELTFDDEFVNDHGNYQGVFFKWGSLYAMSPRNNSIIYRPQNVDGSVKYQQASLAYGSVPYMTDGSGTDRSRLYLYTYTQAVSATATLGDICKFLTELNGGAIHGKKWRMPSRNEMNAWSSSTANPSSWTGQTSNADDGTYQVPHVRVLSGNRIPATGYRHTNGDVKDVGTGGYAWSSSPCNDNGFYLRSNSDEVPDLNANRRIGISVRCVVEK